MTIKGKGAFVTHNAVTQWGRWHACGLQWCALQHLFMWGETTGEVGASETTRTAPRLIDEAFAARARGCAVWWWSWVVPTRVDAFCARLAADLELCGEAGPEGIILNLELDEPQGAQGRGRPAWDLAVDGVDDAAARLVRGVREAWPGEVYATSHGLQSRRQPWARFGEFDGVLPQAYNPSCSYESGFVQRCLDSYERGAFVGKHVAPLLGANSTPAACMRRYVREAEDAHVDACGWWAWTGLAASAAKRAEVAACGIPAR